MRRIIYLLIGLGLFASLLYYKGKSEPKLSPSVSYNMDKHLSAGLSLQLPLRDHNALSMVSGELFFRGSYELLPRLSVSLSAVGGVGTTGFYKDDVDIEYRFIEGSGGNLEERTRGQYIRARYYAGLRPSVSYALGSRLAVSVGYGFLGYLSHYNLHIFPNVESIPHHLVGEMAEGRWGFSSHATYGNALRIGLRYSL